ncbi:peroxiredoxin-like family protein [Fontibacter flavus]|uniref:thioredoxin-dependent peroxiredoxin n=1 Tax=Fontibacter flavus TaxID=654838 RepID=A0ABV6FWV3_9BACT
MNKFLMIMALFSFLSVWNQAQAQTKFKTVNQAKGLSVGEVAPKFNSSDQENRSFNLENTLESGPVVLIFYRGQWCPVCNKHLAAIEQDLDQIYAKGATVVAVSPETSEFLKQTMKKTGASFKLLHDEDYGIAEAYDVAFLSDEASLNAYNERLGANLQEAHSDDSQRLPIPATYIIGQDGIIKWRHFDPDYRKRASVEDIVAALSEL